MAEALAWLFSLSIIMMVAFLPVYIMLRIVGAVTNRARKIFSPRR